ncbi:MAG: hypothetical protein ACJ76Z_06455 [Thermoleophilaceae bacterium]
MTQIAQPQVHLSTLRSHRRLVLAALAALVAAAVTISLVIAIGGSSSATPAPVHRTTSAVADGGPAAGTPSAVAQAQGAEHVRTGLSLTTNVPPVPRTDAGPSTGTPTAVRDALSGR